LACIRACRFTSLRRAFKALSFEPQFKGLRYFCLAGTDHRDQPGLGVVVGDYIQWRNQ
jgi:hypothetical protein